MKAKVGVFTLMAGDLQGAEMAGIFIKALPAMKRFILRHPPPFIAKITKSSSISLLIDN